MNIWSLVKHDNIKLLLINMQMQLGKASFDLFDENDKNFFSIVLKKPDQPDVSAYIYTYKQAKELYGLHLEYPRLLENGYNENFVIYDELSLQQIIDTLATHFEVVDFETMI